MRRSVLVGLLLAALLAAGWILPLAQVAAETALPLTTRSTATGEDEEFVDEEEIAGDSSGIAGSEKPFSPPASQPWFQRLLKAARDHPYELAAACTVLAFVLSYFTGKRQNDAIAVGWLKATLNLFDQQFASVAVKHEKGASVKMDQITSSLYRLQLSGRVNTAGAVMTLALRDRQDMLLGSLNALLGTEDRLIFEVLLSSAVPAVFAVTQRSAEKALRRENKDLKEFSTAVAASALPRPLAGGGYAVLSEHSELVRSWLPEEVAVVVAEAGKTFVSLHVTDRNSQSKHGPVVRLVCRLPALARSEAGIVPLIRLTLALADRVATTVLSREAAQRAQDLRAKAQKEQQRASHKEREEELKQKRLEREQQERAAQEAQLARLPPDERARAEAKLAEKRREKEMKAKMRGRVKVVRA